jgi:hypothetical protein
MTESCEIVRQTYQPSVAEPALRPDSPNKNACYALVASGSSFLGPANRSSRPS